MEKKGSGLSQHSQSEINPKILIAFYRAYAPEKTEADAMKIVNSGMSLKELNEKLKIKYGADLSVVSPLSPSIGRRQPSDLQPAAPGISAAQSLDKNLLILRKGELVDFYAIHDPTRHDIEGHVDRLFERYSFDNIKQALMSKYGSCPTDW